MAVNETDDKVNLKTSDSQLSHSFKIKMLSKHKPEGFHSKQSKTKGMLYPANESRH